MGILVGWITRSFLTEKMLRSVVLVLGDYLVKSSKNSLDDKLWERVKVVLKK